MLREGEGTVFRFPSFPSELSIVEKPLLPPLHLATVPSSQEHILARSSWAGKAKVGQLSALTLSFQAAQRWRLLWAKKGHSLRVAHKPHVTYPCSSAMNKLLACDAISVKIKQIKTHWILPEREEENVLAWRWSRGREVDVREQVWQKDQEERSDEKGPLAQ